MPVIRLALIIIFIIFSSGLAVQVMQSKGINYLYIMDCDPHFKMTHYQLYKVSIILFFLTSSCFAGQLMMIDLDYQTYEVPKKYLFFLICSLLVYCCQPFFKCGYRTARFQIGKTIWEITKSPFGRVKFRDFFFADIITSIGTTLHDVGYTFYFMTSRTIIHNGQKQEKSDFSKYLKYEALPIYYIIVGFIPFWFRFWQCINKYHYTKLRAHLINAGKYFSKLVVPAVTIFFSKKVKVGDDGFAFYLFFNMIATIYCLIWDYYMDWGLFRSNEIPKTWLRD